MTEAELFKLLGQYSPWAAVLVMFAYILVNKLAPSWVNNIIEERKAQRAAANADRENLDKMLQMFRDGQIMSRSSMESVVEAVSARIVASVAILLKEHDAGASADHDKMLQLLQQHDSHAMSVERDAQIIREFVERANVQPIDRAKRT